MRLSHTAITTYQSCGLKYKYHYIDRLRPEGIGSPLIFGNAVDAGINELVDSKDLDKANGAFVKAFTNTNYNGDSIFCPTSDKIVYITEYDFKESLLTTEDFEYLANNPDVKQEWVSLRRKGFIMLEGYKTWVLPRIKEVLASQKTVTLTNDQGDTFIGKIDLIVRLTDDKIYLVDNKTSSTKYGPESASRSQQLALYTYCEEIYNIDGVAFFVMNKNIWEKKTKICSVCGFDGSGSSFRSCQNVKDGVRCHAEWNSTSINKCFIDIILNDVNEKTIDLSLKTLDNTMEGIKRELFPPNLESCKRGKIECPYSAFCFKGDKTGLKEMKIDEKTTSSVVK